MADFKALIDQQVANAFTLLNQGNLTVDLTLRLLVSQGEYDAVTDTMTPVYNDVPKITAILAKPQAGDVKDHGVTFTDGKLIIQGTAIPSEPDTETDRAVFNSREWNIRKCIGVPGQGIYIIYVNL